MAPLQVVPVLDGLRAWADAWPDEALYIWLREGVETQRLTFGQLHSRAGAVAHALTQRWGVARGDRVLLVYPPGLEFAVALFACFRAGVVAVPVYPPDPSKAAAPQLAALGRVASSAGADVALTDTSYVWVVRALRLRHGLGAVWPRRVTWRATSALGGTGGSGDAFAGRDAPAAPADVAFLQFTSGSTSAPKGVCVTHACLSHNCAIIRRAMGITAADCEVSWLPQYHDMGLIGGMLAAVTVPVPPPAADGSAAKPTRAAPCVLMSPVDFLKDPLAWPRALSRYRATHTQAPDFAYALVAARAATSAAAGSFDAAALDLSSLRRALSGAEAARPATVAAFCAAFSQSNLDPAALVAGYGLAEHTVYVCDGGRRVLELDAAALQVADVATGAPAGTARPPPPGARALRLLSCGAPPDEAAGGPHLRIVHPVTRQPLPPNAVGEIWLAGASVAAGYWAQPGLTTATFHAQLATADDVASDSVSYLRTGDLGFVSAEGGELFFVGRMKDILVVRGRNVAPEDLELAATAAVPALRPGCAAAFARDEHGGDGNAAVVMVCEVRDGRLSAAAAGAAVAAVRAAAAAQGVTLADVALLLPRTIPKTTSGKVRRFECRRRYDERSLALLPTQPAAQSSGSAGTTAGTTASPASPALPAGLGARLSPLPRHRRRAELCRAVSRHVAVTWALPPPPPRADLLQAGLDSAAAAALHGALEFALGAPLPPALLLDARTPSTLAAAAEAARWPPGAPDGDAARAAAAAAWAADDVADADEEGGEPFEDDVASAAAPSPNAKATSAAQRRAGALLALLCAATVAAHVASMATLRSADGTPLRWWGRQPAQLIAGAAYRPGWVPGEPRRCVDCAHWRLLEWARTVLPLQLLLCAATAALTHFAPASRRATTAALGVAHAAALHGVWAAPLLLLALAHFALGAACRRAPGGARRVRLAAAWALTLVPMGVYNALEPGNLLWHRTAGAAMRADDAESAASSSLDSGSESSLFEELELFLAYVLYAPLYLCGPVMTFSAFRRSPAAQAGPPAAPSSLAQPPAEEAPPSSLQQQQQQQQQQHDSQPPVVGWRAAASAVFSAVCCCVCLELALHTAYAPSAVFYPSFSHGTALLTWQLQPWDWALNAFAFLTATWATSHVVFALPRGVAAAQGVAAPHDTPLLWTTASTSCRRYWANFHASLFEVFMRYIFLPLGGGTGALLATVAFSTFLHGFHAHWAAWGAGNAVTLALERCLARRARWYATPSAPVRAVNQAAAVLLMTALAIGAEMPRPALGHVAAFALLFAAANAVWLGR